MEVAMTHHVFLDSWLAEFETEWRRIHRTVHLEAVGYTIRARRNFIGR
jgi:hypothetical protein